MRNIQLLTLVVAAFAAAWIASVTPWRISGDYSVAMGIMGVSWLVAMAGICKERVAPVERSKAYRHAHG